MQVSRITPATYISPATQPVVKENPAAPPEAQKLDPIDISVFSRVDRNTDAGAIRDVNKKSFKSMKDYIQYMLLMYAKLRDLKPQPGEITAKMEDQAELADVRETINKAEVVA